MADSRASDVVTISPSFSCLTSGITTADDVPPTMAPVAQAIVRSRPSTAVQKPAVTAAVVRKPPTVNASVRPAWWASMRDVSASSCAGA
jgi:hypothetical protein